MHLLLAHITWFATRLRTLIDAASAQPGLAITLRIYITCDSSLTALTDDPSSAAAAPSATPFDLPHTQVLYMRPHLASIVKDTIGAALAPCGSCYPVCHCGEDNGNGMCANDEEECSGNGPANGRELLSEKDKDDKDERDEVDELPSLAKSCCKPSASLSSGDSDEISVIPDAPSAGPTCCAPKREEGSSIVKPSACGGSC